MSCTFFQSALCSCFIHALCNTNYWKLVCRLICSANCGIHMNTTNATKTSAWASRASSPLPGSVLVWFIVYDLRPHLPNNVHGGGMCTKVSNPCRSKKSPVQITRSYASCDCIYSSIVPGQITTDTDEVFCCSVPTQQCMSIWRLHLTGDITGLSSRCLFTHLR